MAVKSERFLSFTRVLVLGYLLICKPSLSFVLPEECTDLASSVLRDGVDLTDVKVWPKLTSCLTKFHKQNPLLAEKLGFLIDPTKAGPFAALIISIYLTKDAFDLYYKRLPQHLEFIKDYRESLRITREEEIEPLLMDINEVRYNWEESQLEKILKLLMERLEKIHNTIKDMLLKAMAEKVKLKETEGDAIFKGMTLVTVVSGTVIAITSGVACISAYVAPVAIGFGSVGVVCLYNSWSESIKMAKELEKLQDETYKYKRKVAAGKSRVNRLLIEAYRTGSQKAVGG